MYLHYIVLCCVYHTHCPTLIPHSTKRKRLTPPRLSINSLDFKNRVHVKILSELGIQVDTMEGEKVQVSHNMAKAMTPEDAEEGWYLMQDIVKLMNQQHSTGKLQLLQCHVQMSWLECIAW